jgi:hypothetical protein
VGKEWRRLISETIMKLTNMLTEEASLAFNDGDQCLETNYTDLTTAFTLGLT